MLLHAPCFMKFVKWFINELNFPARCRKYGISLWQCPQFLFIVMGGVIITAMLATFYIGTRYYDEPGIAALIVMGVTLALFIIGYSITRGFEHLAEAMRMKSEFVSIVSHQLRSPLSNLKWSIEFLMSGRAGHLDMKQLEYVVSLKENTGRMVSLVTDLLKVSQIDQGTLPLEYASFSLPDLVRKVIAGFESYAKAHNARFDMSIQESVSPVYADQEKVKWVLENLVDNAIRYSIGEATVSIAVVSKDSFLHCEVWDTGIGIPFADQKHIFQKFFRSKSVLRYETEGSGLGLYIAKAYIEKMGGKIGFTSRPNKGSTFWFTLPIVKS